jgi:hypothetical protein
MEIGPLLVEQRATGDEFRVVEKDIQKLQKVLSGRGVGEGERRQSEEALAFGWVELHRLSRRMIELDASVTIAALRAR